tara:strand:+ start:109 stop:366 length:258 start_codon:yes stop_codon:yes gene_type:complete
MNKEKIQNQITKNWNSKSSYDAELMFNVDKLITWDEYYEMNNIHVEFEEGCEKLGFKLPFHGASESVELADEYAEPWVSNSMWCS